MTQYCAFVSVLPASPSTPPATLEAAVRSLAYAPLALEWIESRHCSLPHPQLPAPLPYVELTCFITTEMNRADAAAAMGQFLEQLDSMHPAIGNAELLHLLTCPMPLCSPPLAQLKVAADGEAAATALASFGLAILPSVLGQEQLTELQAHASAWWRLLEERITAIRGKDPGATIRFREVTERDTGRFDAQFTEGCAEARDAMQSMAMGGPWMPLVRRMLSTDFALLRCGFVCATPGTGHQYWHSDGPHRGPAAGWDGCGAAPPYAFCVFVPLVDLTEETGYTQFWAGSHKYAGLLDAKGEQCVPGDTDATCAAGSAVVYDFRVVHRGMPNRSTSPRPILYFLYATPDFNEDYNFGANSIFG
eukprot:GGOE01049794.1.p1 GENE.GGOE01049794.1~~GGOE01049794.1.p1  ORF type:complete len:374 (+),score=95.12 GGOE01049794.1:39-1124(+)